MLLKCPVCNKTPDFFDINFGSETEHKKALGCISPMDIPPFQDSPHSIVVTTSATNNYSKLVDLWEDLVLQVI